MAAKKLTSNMMLDVVKELQKEQVSTKSRKNLFLTDESYGRLQRYCKKQGISVSELLDKWISTFLESVER